MLRWLREVFWGVKRTKVDVLNERLRLCAIAGKKPEDMSNFWVGIEELKQSYYSSRPSNPPSDVAVSGRRQ